MGLARLDRIRSVKYKFGEEKIISKERDMAYQCMDCSYKSAKGFSGGNCPGCGSFNIKSARKSIVYEPEKPRKTLLELAMMFLLWGLIIFGVWDKYLS